MAYGEKYKYYFYWDHDSSNNYYKVSFLYEGYASTVTELTPTETPFVLNIKGQLDTEENPILGSSVQMNIIADGADYTTYDSDFLESNYKDGIVKLIQDPDGTPEVKWVGILEPANADRSYFGEKKIYSLSAVDGLADLKNKKYSTDGTTTGSRFTGFENMLEIIKTALSKVADISELQLDFRINLGTFSDQMTNVSGALHTDQALKDNEIVQELYSEEKDNEIDFNNCYEVLQKILIPFDCTLMQSEGYYYIICTGEKNTSVWEYDWATLTEQSRTVWTGKSVSASTYKWVGNGTLYKKPPPKSITVNLYNKDYNPELIVNGGFDTNITGWTNGDADDDSNPFESLVWVSDGVFGGSIEPSWAGAASAGKYNFHTTASITLDVGGGVQDVILIYKIKRTSETPSDLSAPKVQARLWNATDGYLASVSGQRTIFNFGEYVTYTDRFVVTGLTVAANYLDFEIEITDATTTEAIFNMDNISMVQLSAETPSDFQYLGTRSSGSQTVTKDIIAYLAEQQESDNDICAIKDIGGTYVSTWGRWNFPAETRSLIEILQQYRFNSGRDYMSYVRGTIYDPDETISSRNVLSLDDGDYRIIGIKKNYRTAMVTVDLIQIIYVGLFLPSDTSFNSGVKKLATQYGQSQD